MKGRKVWRKILYEDQGYPDNYTDKTFLLELRRNVERREVTAKEALLGASLVTEQLCTVIAFVLVYFHLHSGIDPTVVFHATTACTVVGFVALRAGERWGDDVRTALIFLVFGHLFSPVLHTLTDTVSTDTVYTTTFFAMLVHLVFFDYGVPAAVVSNSLSLSAAMFGSICLASRLPSAFHAFVLITVAIEIFVLFPPFRRRIGRSVAAPCLLIAGVSTALYPVSASLTALFICTIVVVNVVCPCLFVRYQSYKDNIYGPWDEAVVDDADNINDLIYS